MERANKTYPNLIVVRPKSVSPLDMAGLVTDFIACQWIVNVLVRFIAEPIKRLPGVRFDALLMILDTCQYAAVHERQTQYGESYTSNLVKRHISSELTNFA